MALTMSRTPTFVAQPPSYIRVIPDTLANLPAVDADHIPLPDGTVFHGLQPASRVSPALRSELARVNFSGTFGGFLHGEDAAQGGHAAARWLFRGIRWVPTLPALSMTTVNPGYHGVWLGSFTGDFTAYGTIGSQPNIPNRLLFAQCLVDGDLDNYGAGVGQLFRLAMHYFGFVNSWITGNWFNGAGNQNEVFQIEGSDAGPYQIENNTIPSPGDNWILTGGNPARTWPHIPSVTLRRNDLVVPPSWVPSEQFTADAFFTAPNRGWTFQVSNNGATLTKTAGWTWFSSQTDLFWHSPRAGGYLYEPATGVAREVATVDVAANVVTLTTPWPLANGATFVGYAQMPPPMVLYQSGLTGALAHTTAGSRTVTLDTALPALAYDNCTPIAASTLVETGPFFYTNDTINRGDCGGAMAKSNNWGPGVSVTQPPGSPPPYCWPRYDPAIGRPWQSGDTWNPDSCRRRLEIVAISPDRKTLTLASPYFETIDFTFSIVCNDGLYRQVSMGTKGTFEMKCGDRVLYEGNVVDGELPTTLHPQTNDPSSTVTCAINGDQVTLLGGDITAWPYWFAAIAANWVTYGGTDPLMMRRPASLPRLILWQGGPSGTGYPSKGRYIKSIDSPTTATLWPVDPRYHGEDVFVGGASFTGSFQVMSNTGPHWVVTNHVTRYNLCQPKLYGIFGSNLSGGHAENAGETDGRANNILIHDNLLVYRNHKPWQGQEAVTYSNWPIDQSLARPGLSPLDGDWTDSYGRVSHNAVVHTWPRGPQPLLLVQQLAGWAPLTSTCHHLEVADNLLDQWECLFGGFYGPFASADLALLFSAPYTIARNVLVKSGAPTGVPANLGTFAPDNTGLAAIASVGFANYAFTATDIADPDNYALTDVYSAACTVAGDGRSAEFPSLPAAVVAGQFFKRADKTTLSRVTSVTGGTTVHFADAYPFTGAATGVITFKGSATDGTDPGPNLTILKALTAGVRRAP